MKFIKIRDVKSPSRGTPKSAGIDFYIPNDWNNGQPYYLDPGSRTLIPAGIKVEVPTGHALIAHNKSGVATKKGIIFGAQVVDEDYQGEIHLHIINTNQPTEMISDGIYTRDNGAVELMPGEKLLQFLLIPINYQNPIEVNSIEELYESTSERGEGGFGSTGLK
jgi:dUTP pyrophosphatase